MMNKKESPRIMIAKYLLVIPAMAVALLMVQIPGLQAKENPGASDIVVNTTGSEVIILPGSETNESNPVAEVNLAKKEKAPVVAPDTNVNEQSSGSEKQKNVTDTLLHILTERMSSKIIIIDDKIVLSAKDLENIEIDPEIIKEMRVVKDEAATNGIIFISTKDNNKLQISSLRPQVAETVQVSGTVTNAKDGKTLPGVAIVVKGETTGTITDMNGKFSVDVPANAILKFSYIGVPAQEIAVGNRQQIDVSLSDVCVQTPQEANFQSGKNTPLYVVDGKEINTLSDIAPDKIQSLTVLKDQSAIEAYGDKGKNGVILITTKK